MSGAVACRKTARRSPQGGFNLVELAVALVVMGLLLGGLMVPLTAQTEIKARRETDRALADIREALIGFALVKGRLPCPAPALTPSGNASAGLEARQNGACSCAGGGNAASAAGAPCAGTTAVGVLPWASLALPETDAWGRRYTYAVSTLYGRDRGQDTFGCAVSMNPQFAGFALCSPGSVDLRTAAAGGASLVSGGVPALVVSHGRNGAGAFTPQGTRLASGAADADELENADGDDTFVSSASIDDQFAWVPIPILMQRMVAAGMLP
ncbi:MAG: type II secretion system protein [Ignavibacteria bacterium]